MEVPVCAKKAAEKAGGILDEFGGRVGDGAGPR